MIALVEKRGLTADTAMRRALADYHIEAEVMALAGQRIKAAAAQGHAPGSGVHFETDLLRDDIALDFVGAAAGRAREAPLEHGVAPAVIGRVGADAHRFRAEGARRGEERSLSRAEGRHPKAPSVGVLRRLAPCRLP
jgi:hypothetical protein